MQCMKATMASDKVGSIGVELENIRLDEHKTTSVSALPEENGLEV